MNNISINYILGHDNLKIYQNSSMFRFSLDSLLLPSFVTLNISTKKILDIGTGNAIIPILLTQKTKANIIGVEIQSDVFELGQASVSLNQLENQVTLVLDDINDFSKLSESDQYDVITCNPPYFKVNEGSHFNDNLYKTTARHETTLDLENLFKIAKKLLKNQGVIALVHRPERLIDIIDIMKKNNIEPKKIQFIYPKNNKEANILLIEGKKQGRPGVKVLNPIYAHKENGDYTDQLLKYLKGDI